MKDGYIEDFISGKTVKATLEEIEAVQVFSKQLVEDYNYPKEHIQTKPQFRVKAKPSDTKKEYPVDIAVFKNKIRSEDNIYIIIECKKRTREDGKSQLQDYLRFSKAYLGVWFNGNRRLFLRKIEKAGRVEFEEIPNIPHFKQRVEDIGKFKKGELKPKATHNLKSVFKAIRNHLAANAIGTTRDEALAVELINLIFCKLYDEKNTRLTEIIRFRAGIDEKPEQIKERILEIFNHVKKESDGVINDKDEITLDAKSISYVVGELQNYALMQTERDVIADAFEAFIGHTLKGEQGQFFTPRNVVQMAVDIIDPNENETIIDPACGSGGFLIDSMKYVWQKLKQKNKEYGWKAEFTRDKQIKYATENIRGIDKDFFLSKVAKAYMTIMGDGTSGIFCEDSLKKPKNWNVKTQVNIDLEKFDILFTNPPFGSKIPVSGEDKLKQFELGYKWKRDKQTGKWETTNRLEDKKAPQILFIERCLQLLKKGGRMAIILPDGIYGNESLGYIRSWLLGKARIVAIIDVPVETFMPNTSTKTSILILQKLSKNKIPNDYPVFMALAETCGHDRRGNLKKNDDISKISGEFTKWAKENNFSF